VPRCTASHTATITGLGTANHIEPCVISGLCREVRENCAFLGCFAASSGNSLPTFRDNLSFPSIFWLSVRVKWKR
jgi:hypothetical protein